MTTLPQTSPRCAASVSFVSSLRERKRERDVALPQECSQAAESLLSTSLLSLDDDC